MKKKIYSSLFIVDCSLFVVCCSFIVLIITFGCQKAQQQTGAGANTRAISEEMAQKSRFEQTQKENEQLKRQVETLSKLPGDKRAEAVYNLKKVEIGKYTNLFDEDKNGKKESLIVYVSPIDEAGDAIKAAGEVNIQLWDLSKGSANALLSEWTIEPNEMKKQWYDTLLQTGYRFVFDINAIEPKLSRDKSELTVKMTFTDYLSGKVFTEQKALKN